MRQKDWLIRSLVEEMSLGDNAGSVFLELPELTPDERAELRNVCMVPGLEAHFYAKAVAIGSEWVTDELYLSAFPRRPVS